MFVSGLVLILLGGFIATQNTASKIAVPLTFTGLVIAIVGLKL